MKRVTLEQILHHQIAQKYLARSGVAHALTVTSHAFSLAKEAGVEILPVVMTGTNETFKKGWLVNWRHRVAIRVLKPVSVEEVAATGTKELSLQVRERMVTALAELREEVKSEKK